MILFLDDSPERAARAYSLMTPEQASSTIWCTTAQETIITLRDYCEVLEEVHLDHDLGGLKDQSIKDENCGMEVVRWMEDNLDKVKHMKDNGCTFTVHSWNLHAGRIMVERLKRLDLKAIFKPFGS